MCVQPQWAESGAGVLVASSREQEVLRASVGSGIADLVADAARGDLLHGAVTQEDVAGVLHEWLAWGLIILAGLHALAALKHHFIDRDGLMSRMGFGR